eukprot:TRINITY_DN4271_c0_g1_i1.p1 TRINITY_DN4271_c0_g1~~TRINITY_DN4271_c0_g1_i1.p1  ORF type:complete len:253 (+),score=29.44 TRINITY_DN4271_c0_g1_i1:982-1740(+)
MGQVLGTVVDGAHYAWVGKTHPMEQANYWSHSQSKLVTYGVNSLPEKMNRAVRIVCISDTHEYHSKVKIPTADIMIVAGDVLLMDRHCPTSHSKKKIKELGSWIRSQPVQHCVFIAGNHDKVFEDVGPAEVKKLLGGRNIHYLVNESVTLCGLKFFGTPFSFGHSKNSAFQPRSRSFPSVPKGIDVLVTHQPAPKCKPLREIIQNSCKKLHVGGHHHWLYGVQKVESVNTVTASIMDSKYKPTNPPIVYDVV